MLKYNIVFQNNIQFNVTDNATKMAAYMSYISGGKQATAVKMHGNIIG